MATSTAGPAPANAAGPSPRPDRWLFGPVSDIWLGCGLLYVVVFLLYSIAGPAIRVKQPAYLIQLLVILIAMPHYGGTLLRVYEHRRDRRAYALFAVHATVLVAALFVAGVYSPFIGSLLFTVYTTWSPWHYTGQNYGIAVMFLRRRGVSLDPPVKRLLYASFLLSYGLVFIAFHGSAGGAISYAPLEYVNVERIAFLPIGIPHALLVWVAPAVAVAYIGTTIAALAALLRRASLQDILPAVLLMLSQVLWFSLPFAARYFDFTTGLDPVDSQERVRDYVFFVALAHSAQYLWVTSYYAKHSDGWKGFGPYGFKVAASGVAIWTLPAVVFAPDALGTFSYNGGLALLIASVVNLHHFILDGAIWKLRNMRIGGVLIRSQADHDESTPIGSESTWLRSVVWGIATLGLITGFAAFWLTRIAAPAALGAQDIERGERIADTLAWIGRDSASLRTQLGSGESRRGDLDEAIVQLDRSIALNPTASAYVQLANVHHRLKQWEQTLAAAMAGLELEPGNPTLLSLAGSAHAHLGDLELALSFFDAAAQIQPDSPQHRENIDKVRARMGAHAQ